MKKTILLTILFFSNYTSASEYVVQAFQHANAKKWEAVYNLLDEKKVDIEDDEPREKYSFLTIATIEGNIEATRELLRRGSDINRQKPITPIMRASGATAHK